MKTRYRSGTRPHLLPLRPRVRRISLRLLVVIPFVLLILGVVSLVGCLSYGNAQAVIAELSQEMRSEIAVRIEQKLSDRLHTSQLVNQINVDALESGLIQAENLSSLQSYLLRQLRQFPTLSGITIATESPDYISVKHGENGSMVLSRWNRSQGGVIDSILDSSGSVLSAQTTLDYDHRNRPWYRNTIQAHRPLWQNAHLALNSARLVISTSHPFFDSQGRLLGVVNAEMTLSSLSEFLDRLSIGRTGQAFIMEQNGWLLAAADQQLDLQTHAEKRQSVSDSSDRLIRAAAHYLNAEFKDLQRSDRPHQLAFNLDGQQKLLTVMPFGDDFGIDWLIVVIAPKGDFTSQIAAHTQNMLLLCIVTLLTAIGLSLWISEWIVQPLLRMSRTSQAIAAGQLDQRVAVDLPVAELNVMAHSFNRMAEQLEQSFDQINDALQASEAKFTKVFRACPEAIAITTVNSGRYVDVNTSFCQISGYDREEVIGRTPFDLRFPFTPAGFARFGQLLRKRQILRNIEVGFQTKTGEAKIALVSAERIEIEGQPCILAVIKDISEHKQIAAELEQAKEAAEAASRTKSQFLAHMSHELRSPLNAILGFAQLMSLSRSLASEHRHYVNIIHHSSEHLLHLINSILDSSKIEAGCLTLDESSFDLHRLLQELIEMFGLKAREKAIELSCDRAATVPQWIVADELKLRQVLINLLNNALKFTDSGHVSLRVTGETAAKSHESEMTPLLFHSSDPPLLATLTLHFAVSDTGIGIDSSQLGDIFEAFVQTSSGRQAAEGTGLGLSISRAFVQLMGGDIEVRSTVGEGSVFSFAIPVGIVSPPLPLSAPYRCLVANDNSRDRQVLTPLLHSLGCDIREATNGQQAIALCQSWQPHLIWIDVQMVRLVGVTATRQMRTPVSQKAPPTVIAIGGSEAEDRSIARSAGCDDFLSRPLYESKIRSTIDRYLGKRGDITESRLPSLPADLSDLRQQVARLPHQWIASFHQATLKGDFDLMLMLIDQIRHQSDLAETIASLAHRFQYVQLLALTQPFAPPPQTSP